MSADLAMPRMHEPHVRPPRLHLGKIRWPHIRPPKMNRWRTDMNKEAFERGFAKAAIEHGLGAYTAIKLANQFVNTAAGSIGGGVVGGLLGALKGGAIGLPIGGVVGGMEEMNKPKDQRHYAQGILSGGADGALIGGGAGGVIGGGLGALTGGVGGYNYSGIQEQIAQMMQQQPHLKQ